METAILFLGFLVVIVLIGLVLVILRYEKKVQALDFRVEQLENKQNWLKKELPLTHRRGVSIHE